jgi:hypothetical protein
MEIVIASTTKYQIGLLFPIDHAQANLSLAIATNSLWTTVGTAHDGIMTDNSNLNASAA